MLCSKCRKCMRLCPFSFGLAFGITTALAILIMFAWGMYHGMSPMMENMPVPTWEEAWGTIWRAFLKAFFFGFFLALFYDWIARCVRGCCGKKSGTCSSCGCNTEGNNKAS